MWTNLIKSIVISLVLALVSAGGLAYKHAVERAAIAEQQQKELENVIANQQDYINKMQQVADEQTTEVADLKKQNEDLDLKLNDLAKYLNSNDAKKIDRQSSEVLKRTIRDLIKASK